MNGIIHPASHPEDRPPPETEDDMYLAIFDYLERSARAQAHRMPHTRRIVCAHAAALAP